MNSNLHDTENWHSDDLKFKLRQILNFLEAGAVEQDLARLSALQPTLSDSAVVTKFPHLTAAIFSQLVNLSSGSSKEVSRITNGLLDAMLQSLPFVQSIRLINNVIRTASSDKIVTGLKSLDKLLKQSDLKHLKEHLKESLLGLLKVSEWYVFAVNN